MRRFIYGIATFAALVFISACTPPRHMIVRENARVDLRNIKPESGKAALVVARTTNYGGAIEFDTYLDKKMIGVTQRKGFFIKSDVAPGPRYVISRAENMEPIRILFERDRVYYLLQIPRLGVWKARVSVAPVTADELMTTMDEDCRLMEYNPSDPGDDLSDEEFNGAIRDYERELGEGRHQDHVNYRGGEAGK